MKNEKDYCCPQFNPNNPYEIAYIVTFNSGLRQLYKFNFKTGVKTYLTDNVLDEFSWGSNEWILLSGCDYQIWKIKDNGDSMTRITNTSAINSNPLWSKSCSYYTYNSDIAQTPTTLVNKIHLLQK
jgi:Tol biopolymer transport system component